MYSICILLKYNSLPRHCDENTSHPVSVWEQQALHDKNTLPIILKTHKASIAQLKHILRSSFHHISERKASNLGWVKLEKRTRNMKNIHFIPDDLQYSDKVSSQEDIKEVLLSYNSHNAIEKLGLYLYSKKCTVFSSKLYSFSLAAYKMCSNDIINIHQNQYQFVYNTIININTPSNQKVRTKSNVLHLWSLWHNLDSEYTRKRCH